MTAPRKDNPSSIFYWKDYENDEGLRISSLAAQGLWMRLLCVAAKADPYGYVLVNGCDIGVTGAARLGSVTEAEAATLLDELERNGVFSRDRKGRAYCRRMVKDAATRAKNTKNGKKGGNPALSVSDGKEKKITGSLNPPDNPPLKAPYPLPLSPYPNSKEEDGGGGSARGEIPTFRERLLTAIGVDPVSGLTGHGSKRLGTMTDMAEAQRWLAMPGISEDVALAEVVRVTANKRDGPPNSFKFFSQAMQRLSGELSSPALVPINPQNPNGAANAKPDRAKFDAAHREYLRRRAAGEIASRPDPSDPFARAV